MNTEASLAAARASIKQWRGTRTRRGTWVLLLAAAVTLSSCAGGMSGAIASETDASLYRDAYVYGYPMVDNYRVMHSYFSDRDDPEYKGAWNEVHNVARVFTPQDKAIQTPNSDTPYSFLGADLRAEPLVISVPAINERYYSLQFIDLYTHNFAYVGSRTTGNGAGTFLLAGPDWKGEVPDGISSVLRSETQLALVLYRTQLFGEDDLREVKQVQAGFEVVPLSAFTGTPPPKAPKGEFARPLSLEEQKASPEFFDLLNHLLQYAPVHPTEVALRERFAAAGVAPDRPFAARLDDRKRAAVESGIAAAWRDFASFKAEMIDTGKRSAADGFGTREFLANDYLARMSSAVLGIYGNSKEEALYMAYFLDADGAPLDASSNRYTVRFGPEALPPVNAFWSITMYELPGSLLTANPIDRYLINATMVPDLVRDPDGGIRIHVQKAPPEMGQEANWLPAPDGPFLMILRAYWPKPEMLAGNWKHPPALRVKAPALTSPAASAAPQPAVPDLSDPRFWVRNSEGKILVTPDNFIRAESNLYMAGQVKGGAFGKFVHTREPTPIDGQKIIRLNRDTVYSSAVFDLDAGPVDLTLPDGNGRFLSAMLVNEDHFNPQVYYEPGTYRLTREDAGTRYLMVGVRILADPNDPEDMKQANALQDAIAASQPGGPGVFEVPQWDPESQAFVRKALLELSSTLPDLRYAAGPGRNAVDPVRRLIAAASGWGLNPDQDAVYLNVFPRRNDGRTVHVLEVGDVPVNAFWSISVYNRDGYFAANELNAYVVNSVTASKANDGSTTIQFGDCKSGMSNCLPITDGWNYMARLYRPRGEILDGSWSFPVARPRD